MGAQRPLAEGQHGVVAVDEAAEPQLHLLRFEVVEPVGVGRGEDHRVEGAGAERPDGLEGVALDDALPPPPARPPGRHVGQHPGQLGPEGRPNEDLLVGTEPGDLPVAVGAGDVTARAALAVAVLDAVALLEVAADRLENRQPGQ